MKALVVDRMSPMTYTPDDIDRLPQTADLEHTVKAAPTAGAGTIPLQTADTEEASRC